MRAKVLSAEDPRTIAVVFDTGDSVVDGLIAVAREQRLRGSHLTAIGALQEVTLGCWDYERKEYRRLQIAHRLEVLSLLGNVAQAPDGGPGLHAHIVVGKPDGRAHGGHLLAARVRPTLEVVLVESPGYLQRRVDPATGLALLALCRVRDALIRHRPGIARPHPV
ncbi:MAG TPA: PPC domain-containing DNA-binding protein [Gemmatimonadales bacterium]|nr:PPC domain-containing DNA-binding protein [Gemmatimonadales bacterium]